MWCIRWLKQKKVADYARMHRVRPAATHFGIVRKNVQRWLHERVEKVKGRGRIEKEKAKAHLPQRNGWQDLTMVFVESSSAAEQALVTGWYQSTLCRKRPLYYKGLFLCNLVPILYGSFLCTITYGSFYVQSSLYHMGLSYVSSLLYIVSQSVKF